MKFNKIMSVAVATYFMFCGVQFYNYVAQLNEFSDNELITLIELLEDHTPEKTSEKEKKSQSENLEKLFYRLQAKSKNEFLNIRINHLLHTLALNYKSHVSDITSPPPEGV